MAWNTQITHDSDRYSNHNDERGYSHMQRPREEEEAMSVYADPAAGLPSCISLIFMRPARALQQHSSVHQAAVYSDHLNHSWIKMQVTLHEDDGE